MTKKTWIFIGVATLLVATGGFFYFKKRKAMADAMANSEAETEVETAETTEQKKTPLPDGGEIVGPSKSISQTDQVEQSGQMSSQIASPILDQSDSLPVGTAKMLRVVKDNSKGKAILRVTPKNMFKVGDTVNVKGAVYNGKFKIWYIFKSHQTEDALYIETPYVSDDSGTVTKA